MLFLKESNPKINKIKPQVFVMACHPFGCRVVQRVLEHCTQQQVICFVLVFWCFSVVVVLVVVVVVVVVVVITSSGR